MRPLAIQSGWRIAVAAALLGKTVDMGRCNAAAFRIESALDPLRQREDCTKLVEELEEPSPAKLWS